MNTVSIATKSTPTSNSTVSSTTMYSTNPTTPNVLPLSSLIPRLQLIQETRLYLVDW